MTNERNANLFAEMDKIADELRKDPMWVPEDEQIAFRRLTRDYLTREQSADLFMVWSLHNLGKMKIEIAKTREHIVEQRKALFGDHQGGRAFLCACGVMLEDAFDVRTMMEHRPHMLAAGVLRRD